MNIRIKKDFQKIIFLFPALLFTLLIPCRTNALSLVRDKQASQGETVSVTIPKYDFTDIRGEFEGETIPFFQSTQQIDQSENITRAEFVKLIALNKEQFGTQQSIPLFRDVGPRSEYFEAVQSAASAGIIGGYADGLFHPFEKVTRAQAAKIILNAYNPKQTLVDIKPFPDVPENHSLKSYWKY